MVNYNECEQNVQWKEKNIVDIFWKMQYNFKYIKNNLYKPKIKSEQGVLITLMQKIKTMENHN